MSTTAAANNNFNQLHGNQSPGGKDQMNSLPTIKPDLLLNDTGLFTVFHFIKNFIG